MKKIRTGVSVKVSMLAFAVFVGYCVRADLSVGYAKYDITPPLGISLSGYGTIRPADGILDRLEAVGIAFSDGTNKAVVISSDIISLRSVSKVYRAKIAAVTGLDPQAIFLCCTHTHTGPSLLRLGYGAEVENLDKCATYDKALCDYLASVAQLALNDLAPAKLSIARGEVKRVSFIRRFLMKDGTYSTNPRVGNPNIVRPESEVDEQLQLVRVDREGKDSIAIVNFQCHPDTIGGKKISGDWPSVVRRTVERVLPNVKCIFINGAQGDSNHICRDPKRALLPPRDIRTHKYMGRAVAGAAIGLWDVCKPVEGGKVGFGITMAHVKSIKPTPEEEAEARKIAALRKAGKKSEIKPLKGLSQWQTISEANHRILKANGPDSFEVPLSAVTIGDTLAFVGFPGEPFTEYGLIMKKYSPFTMTVPACLTNGSFGYMPTDFAMDKAGYETTTTVFSKGLEKAMVDGHLNQLQRLVKAAK